MFNNKKKQEAAQLDAAVAALLAEMLMYGPECPEFQTRLEQMEKVNKVRMTRSVLKSLNSDTLLIVGGNLLGILIIVGYEQRGVVTTAAKNFLLKTK